MTRLFHQVNGQLIDIPCTKQSDLLDNIPLKTVTSMPLS
jgi:hypothetical protein